MARICVLLLAFCGCATYAEQVNRDAPGTAVVRSETLAPPPPPPAPREPVVRVEKSEPPRVCRELGFVDARSPWITTAFDEIVAELKTQVRKRGGNWVTLLSAGSDQIRWATGRAYQCPEDALAEAGGTVVGKAATDGSQACEPDCSPGYVCLHARCVSACNPPCGSGERCGADRLCHERRD